MVNQSTGANSVDAQDVPSAWGARTVLFLLTLIAMVQFFDRALMVVILEPSQSLGWVRWGKCF